MESKYEKPSVTVDVVIFSIIDKKLKVLLVKRNIEPFKDKWAIPGGFVRINESIDECAKRELEEETGVKDVYLEQLYTFGKIDRDPRGRVITVSYMALINSDRVELKATADVKEAKWFTIGDLPELGFDHKDIVDYALKRLRWKFEYTTVGFSMLGDKFTMGQIQELYEIVFQRLFDKRNFVKKIHTLNILEEIGKATDAAHRPPKIYSLNKNIPSILNIL